MYKVHVNTEFKSGVWTFNEISPQSLPLAQKMVFAPDHLTDKDRDSLEKMKTDLTHLPHHERKFWEDEKARYEKEVEFLEYHKKEKEGAKENKESKDNKSLKLEYNYLGNSLPIAIGITAFFFKKNPHDDSPTSSLLSMLQRGERRAIHSWFEEYYENQIAVKREINEVKTKAQGGLTPEQLTETFNRDHLESEQEYYKESEGFFNMVHCEDEHTAKILREYVEGYLAWVEVEITAITNIFPSKYNEVQLNKIADRLVSCDLIGKSEKTKFISLFSDKPQSITWNDKIWGAKATLFSLMDKITGKKLTFNDLKPFVKTASGISVERNWPNTPRTDTRMTDTIFEGL